MLKAAQAAGLFTVEIGKKLLDLLLKPQKDDLKTSMPLVDLGLDSLVALELRAWIKRVFSLDVPMLEMTSMGSLDILGHHAVEDLYRKTTEDKGI